MELINKIKNILSPYNFNFIHEESVESTMISIKNFIGSQNVCMIADEQTSGIGRRGNEWVSPKGNIYISFLIKYDLSIENHFLFSALTANSIIKFLNNHINQNINIALANKETLVVAGDIITKLCKDNNVNILPVDSEHSAIYQCLLGEKNKNIEKVILTASGGPFRGKSIEDLKYIKKEDALNHPNWDMGNKISIDSSTLMNKGLEVIEAKYLFNIDINSIEVVIHPQSIIHSMVEFNDGSIKAQMGEPDMKLPIQFALGYPERLRNNFKRFNFLKNNTLTFEKPCLKTFNNLKLAFEAGEKGGNSPCILNASNEVVVEAFLNEKINYLDMTKLIEDSLNKISYIATPNLEQLIETDLLTRSFINKKIKSL